MKCLSNFKYPKLALLLFFIILAYITFNNPLVGILVSNLGNFSYLTVFIAGIFFAFGFTAPFATGFFITLNPPNLLLAGIIGGLGALSADLLIFRFICVSFEDEFNNLKKSRYAQKISSLIDKNLNQRIKIYVMYAFAGILIASPLPDEAGILLLAGLTKIKISILAILSFLLNTSGIIILLCV